MKENREGSVVRTDDLPYETTGYDKGSVNYQGGDLDSTGFRETGKSPTV